MMTTDIDVSVSGPTATLHKNGWNLTAEIRSPRHAVFDIAPVRAGVPQTQNPVAQPTNPKYRKLIVRLLDKVTELDLNIVMTPWRDGQTMPKVHGSVPGIMTRRLLLQAALGTAGIGKRVTAASAPEQMARRVFDEVNGVRTDTGVDRLTWSDPVAQSAKEQSTRKAALRFPGHDDPERGPIAERLQRDGIPWQNCGENIFLARGIEDPVHYATVFWWYSPGHKANMVNPGYTHTGVGVVLAEDGTYFITQIFILPPQTTTRLRH